MTQIETVTGEEGEFTVKLRENPRFIDIEKCTAC
jgi:heterodisulfide reductase subunit A-like polyferredoxin